MNTTNICKDTARNCTDSVIYVDEQNSRMDEEICDGQVTNRTLVHVLKCTACCITGSTTIHIQGNVTLNTSIVLNGVKNVAVIGKGTNMTHITCGWEMGVFNKSSMGAGFVLHNLTNFTMSDLTLKSCGAIPCGTKAKLRSAIAMKACKDILITRVLIDSSNGNGISMFNMGHVTNITNSTIQNNHIWDGFKKYKKDSNKSVEIHGGGAIHIHMRKVQKAIVNIESCNLNNNTKHNTNSPYEGADTGGGLSIYLADGLKDIVVNVVRCKISNNMAEWGGGVFISIVKNAICNRINIINSIIEGNNVSYLHGGGGMDIGIYKYYYDYKYDPPRNNIIEINNTNLKNNKASYGGGMTIFSNSDLHLTKLNNTIQFYNCKWTGNTASFGAAIDIAPSTFDEAPGNVPVIPLFINCTFKNNYILSQPYKNNREYSFSSAIISITSINVEFKGYTQFKDNDGTALMVNSAIAIFDKNSQVYFINNVGKKGGAIALLGISYIQFSPNSLFYFDGNMAEIGGAIYSETTNKHDYILTRSCFLKQSAREKFNKKTTFTFINNTAKSNIGNTIFAATLIPCNNSCNISKAKQCDRTQPQSIFNCCVADFNFTSNQQNQINTRSYKFNTTIKDTLRAFPGQKIILNPTVLDETDSNINAISRFKVSTEKDSKVQITNNPQYTATGEIIIMGDENSNGTIKLQTSDYRAISIEYNITLSRCPLGYVNSKTTQQCNECICKDSLFFGIHCNVQQDTKSSFITPQTWVGFSKEGTLLSSFCPMGYCKNINNTNGSKLEDLEICANGRQGILCSQCANGLSVWYQSTEYVCGSDDGCSLGVLMYILTELLPVTIIFIIAIIFSISFTSGALNTFILYAQVVQLYDTNDYAYSEKLKYVLKIQRAFYDIFSLNFRWKKYCLWKGATTLDVLAVKYGTILYSLGLVTCLVILLNRFSHHKIIKICHIRGNIIHGLAAFLVVCYSQCAFVTLSLLTPGTLWEQGPTKYKQTVVYLNGNLKYFGRDHIKYGILATFFLTVFIIFPPMVLFFNSIVSAIISVCTKRCCSKPRPFLTNKLLLIRFKPLLDTFQGCFHDSHRVFAGMYFLYRILLLLLNIFSSTDTGFYIYGIVILLLIVVLHAIVQPYKEKWHNILDILFFANIIILNGISLYIYNIFSWNELRSKLPIKSILCVQLILLYSPIVYVVSYVVYNIWKCCKESCLKDSLSVYSGQDDYEDWPERLINDNQQEDRSFLESNY